MRPLRRKKKIQVTYDPVTGQDMELGIEKHQDIRSDERSIDSETFERRHFLDCGCPFEVGGSCYICSARSCVSCSGRCQKCKKPICLEHSCFLTDDDGKELRYCSSCFDDVVRIKQIKKVKQFFLSLFVETKDTSNG